MASQTKPLFIYGTLRALKLLAWALTGDAANVDAVECLTRKAKVSGYSRYSLVHRDYPAVVKSDGASVDGYILMLNADQRKKLDNFEGESEYKITAVAAEVENTDGSTETIQADMYLWVGDAEILTKDPWDLQTFIDERLEDWAGLFSSIELVGEE